MMSSRNRCTMRYGDLRDPYLLRSFCWTMAGLLIVVGLLALAVWTTNRDIAAGDKPPTETFVRGDVAPVNGQMAWTEKGER